MRTPYHYALVALDGANNRSPASETTATPVAAASATALAFNGSSQYYFLGIDASSGRLVGDFEDTADGSNHPVLGTTALTTNAWHHVAATYDGTTWRLYLDGILDTTLAVGTYTPESTSIQHAALATAMDSSGVAAGFFAGTLDEARIWNVARTGAQIQSTRDSELTSGSGLVGRWGLNDGSGTLAANSVAGSPSGTLVGGPARVAGYGFPASNGIPTVTVDGPANGATGVSTSPMLSVTPTDPAGSPMSVTFYGRTAASGLYVLVGTTRGRCLGDDDVDRVAGSQRRPTLRMVCRRQ